ncbi:hypothetical protein IAU60_005856 [Kwoniella sp. DSM 27419]
MQRNTGNNLPYYQCRLELPQGLRDSLRAEVTNSFFKIYKTPRDLPHSEDSYDIVGGGRVKTSIFRRDASDASLAIGGDEPNPLCRQRAVTVEAAYTTAEKNSFVNFSAWAETASLNTLLDLDRRTEWLATVASGAKEGLYHYDWRDNNGSREWTKTLISADQARDTAAEAATLYLYLAHLKSPAITVPGLGLLNDSMSTLDIVWKDNCFYEPELTNWDSDEFTDDRADGIGLIA